MRALAHSQQDLIDELGRFGLLAHCVASQAFLHRPSNGSEAVTSRISSDLHLRIRAMASVAGVATNRVMHELLIAAMDELENALKDERTDVYDDFINTYEILLSDYNEALSHLEK